MSNLEGLLEQYQLQKSFPGLEGKLRGWAKPPGKTEEEKIERSIRMVKAAIDAHSTLKSKNTTTFVKGSYDKRTNIPADSDVDVAVRLNDIYINDYPEGMNATDFNFVDASYTYDNFKSDVEQAIKDYFGVNQVIVGSKAVKVRANSCRIDADVVPLAVHRRYKKDLSYEEGIALRDSLNKTIKNWPQQDYDNGVAKNNRTNKRYKAMVRILKTVRNEMQEENIEAAKDIQSFLIECLLWNVPDDEFGNDQYMDDIRNSLDVLIRETSDLKYCKDWGEVNELKYLFRGSQPWSLHGVNSFLIAAKKYLVGLGL